MTSKWNVNRAVRASDLPPTARLIMLTLSDRARSEDSVISDEHTPSQGEIAADTGLSERTVRDTVKWLEREGWLDLDRPSLAEMVRHKKIRYRLAVPAGRKASPTAGKRRAKRVATATAAASVTSSEENAGQRNEPPENRAPEGTGTGSPCSGETAAPLSLYDLTTTTPPPPADAPAAEAAPTRRSRGRETEPEADNPAVDAVLAKVDFGTEHVSRYTRHRLRLRVAQALAAGWPPPALVHEMTRDLGTARSRVSVVQARLGALGEPPRPTPIPPRFVAPEVPRIAPETVRSRIAEARAALAAGRARLVPQLGM